MKSFLIVSSILALFASALIGCGNEEALNGEDYGNLLISPSGLTLTQSEHEVGWGKSQCDTCHNFNNIHLEDNTGLGVDVEAIREQVFTEGLSSCASCHGANGTN